MVESFETAFQKYSKRIYNFAYRMTGNKDDAMDIAQETFVSAFKSWETFKGDSQTYTWLYIIAKNNCLRFLEKKNKTTFLSLQELTEKAASPVSSDIPEDEKLNYISQVKNGCLSGLLRCLSLQQRIAFIFYVLLDLPMKQVAEIIGKSENATRILVHRSKQNIKEFLCKNCALYDSKNSCHCEDLINFSLKKGWITPNINSDNVRVESEIKDLKNVISLYKTLHEPDSREDLYQIIKQNLSEKENFLILKGGKVK